MNIGDCRACESWRGCPGKTWYSFGEIRWCPQQNFWILKNAYDLESGIYPKGTSIDEQESRSRKSTHDPQFVKSTLLIAQVRMWLKLCGWRGKLLAAECLDPQKEKLLYLSDDAKAALFYISGSRSRIRPFSQWVQDRIYRKAIKLSPYQGLDKRGGAVVV